MAWPEKRQYHTPRWQRLRREIKDRDGWRCKTCGKSGALEVDHVKPRAAGGAFWDPRNLQVLCRGCHIAKTRRENTERTVARDPGRDRWNAFRDALLIP